MKFAKFVFLIGGIYGLLVTVPQYFMEKLVAADYPPPVTHPEYYYLFIGVTAAFQIIFLVISRDPARYRPLMIVSVLEKSAMLVTFLILAPAGRFPQHWMIPFVIDLTLGILFLAAYFKTKPAS